MTVERALEIDRCEFPNRVFQGIETDVMMPGLCAEKANDTTSCRDGM